MKLLNKILWRSKSKWQFILGGTGLLLGLFISLVAMQLRADISKMLSAEGGASEYLVINRQVPTTTALGLGKKATVFTQVQFQKLDQQPFVVDYAPFTSSQFHFTTDIGDQLGFELPGLYAEAVPDRFLDSLPAEWGWEPGQELIPVILNKQLLDEYNFGMALAMGYPQVAPEMIKGVTGNAILRKGSETAEFKVRIVGFTYRTPGWLVPLSFLDWANERFAVKETAGYSKVIIKVIDPTSPELIAFLDSNGFETNTEKLTDTIKRVSLVAVGLLGIFGVLFTVMALLIFVIALQLLLSKSKEEIALLITLGYTPVMLSAQVFKNYLFIMALVTMGAAVSFAFAVLLLHRYLRDVMSASGFEGAGYANAFFTGALLIVVSLGVTYISIKQTLRQISR